MANKLRIYTGKELLVLTGGDPLGDVGIHEIDANIEDAGNDSCMSIALSNFNSWVSELSMNLNVMTDAQFRSMERALKFYALYLYQEWSMLLRSKSECSDDDYRKRANLLRQCRLSLKQIGTHATNFTQKLEDAINAETSVEGIPADISDFIKGSIITDDFHQARRNNDEVSTCRKIEFEDAD